MKKLLTHISLILIVGFVFAGCADLSVQNLNEPTTDAVFADETNLEKLLRGGFSDWAISVISSYATHPDLIADQITSTNNVRNFWDFAQEPRLRLTNSTSYSGANAWENFYSGYNAAVATANLFIKNPDISDAFRAQAYFLRGLGRGYLGMIFDRGYLLSEDFDATEVPEFVAYGALVDGAIADFEQAISLVASASTDFVFKTMPNDTDTWDADEFQDIVNSFAARILASKARTAAEAASIDWSKVLSFAQAGLGGPSAKSSLGVFKNANIGSTGEFSNYYMDWANFIISCANRGEIKTCSGYLPIDVKVIHTMNPDYPTTYPTENAKGTTATLPATTSTDPRLDGYHIYTTNAGFLRSTRNANLYSNYFSARNHSGNDWDQESNEVVLFTDTEVTLLIAEAQLMSGQKAVAATTLNNSPAGTGTTTLGDFELWAVENNIIAEASLSGGWTLAGTESTEAFQFALMREYAVEVNNFGGVGVNWAFMRRHDLLQVGSATMFPVPASQLEVLGLDIYSFGGPSNAGEVGSASGANSWTTLASRAGLTGTVAKNKAVIPFTPNNSKIIPPKSIFSKGAYNQ